MTGPHWDFSLAVYGMPEVALACVLLQDRCGVDVNVLLLSLYASVRLGHRVGRSEIAALDAAIAGMRKDVIEPLRQVRRGMKLADYGPATEQVRNKVKIAELAAEQLEQAALVAVIEAWPASAARSTDAETVTGQVVLYFQALRGPDSPLDEEIGGAIGLVARAAEVSAR